jgi:hypothetical protein
MRGFSRLAARGAALLVLASTSAWAQQQEELWLDTRSSAPVASQVGLKKGWPHLITTYELTGEDSALQVRIADNPVSDNSGRLRIWVLPGA